MSTHIDVDMSVISLLGDKLYSQNQAIVFMRETLQNSIDAAATHINVELEQEDDILNITVTDDGIGINDLQKYFLTIGGSSKREQIGSIGGFGIAKLSIMSMSNWSIESIGGIVTKEILENGLDILPSTLTIGTIVKGTCKIMCGDITVIKDILSMTVNDTVSITCNGIDIEAVEINSIKLYNCNTNYINEMAMHNGIVVRLNGLFMFRECLYLSTDDNRNKTFLYDINTTLSAYDSNYPLNANRESITDQTLLDRYIQVKNEISKLDREQEVIQENEKYNVREYRNYLIAGDIEQSDIKKNIFVLKTWDRYIKQLHESLRIYEEYKVGLSDCEDSQALRHENNNVIGYLINADSLSDKHDKSKILALAIHEITHYFENRHYDSFACKENEIMALVIKGLQDKTFRW